MFQHSTLVVVLALSGFAGSTSPAIDLTAPHPRVMEQTVSGTGRLAQHPAGAPGTRSEGVTLKDLDIVVPPVGSSAGVAASHAPFPTQADAGVVVADQLVAPKRVESEVVSVAGFQTLGVTWPENAKIGTLGGQVRTRTHGTWSGWTDLTPSDNGPDAGTPDAARAVRGGTDPISIGHADAVQLAFTPGAQGGPKGLSLALVGSSDHPGSSALAGSTAGGKALIETAAISAAVAPVAVGPTVITRAQWAAPAQACKPDVAKALVGAVVHHTADSNSYSTVAQAMQQIRNDAAYHITGRGWCDIGYNFIVDKWGNIYEGREGSLTQPVVGAHAAGFNAGTVGVAMLGTFNALPSAATQRSVGQIIGWRLGAYRINPLGSMTYYTTGGGALSRYNDRNVTIPRIVGHRDVGYTACPGNGGWAALPTIRRMAQSAPVGWLDAATSPSVDLISVRGWALDPDTTASIRVHVYVDGKYTAALPAAGARADVGRIYRRGDNHGFNGTVKARGGTHQVCVWAIDLAGGSNPRIGCKTVTVINHAPVGYLDGVSSSEGRILTRGWALDPDTTSPINVHIYVDGRATQSVTANTARPDVGRKYGKGDNHGFNTTVSAVAGRHHVCVYAIDTTGGSNPSIGCKDVTLS